MHLHTTQGPSARGTTSRDPGTTQPTTTPGCGLAPTLGTSCPALGHTGSKSLPAGKPWTASAHSGRLRRWVQIPRPGFLRPALSTPGLYASA